MLSRVFTSSALLKEPSRVAHALNAIGLCAKVAIIVGVNPMFLVNASRVVFESAGTWSGFRAVVRGIVVFLKLLVLLIGESPCGNFLGLLRTQVLGRSWLGLHLRGSLMVASQVV